ncbi:MAG: hypothetical protein HY711_05080 [Candidatus Melainabacteria bacterium]|nr:hypothetical protein [Candidatus Melainabacteria bacterium]
MKSGTQGNTTSSGSSGGVMATAKGMLILILLIVLAGAGGYFFGTYQKFAPVQGVPPGTVGAISDSSSLGGQTPLTMSTPGRLKNQYWIQSKGDQHVGYSIAVFVNGKLVDKFFTPNKTVDISNMVKPGENQVTFQSKLLPAGMREHSGNSAYSLSLDFVSAKTIRPNYTQSDVLLSYKRTAADFEDYNDEMSFVTLE